MRRVLIISPNFPPLNAPDHQRVRMSLPYFEQFGWKPTVLALRPEEGAGVMDPDLLRTVPENVEIIRAGAIPKKITRYIGQETPGLRCLPHVQRAGDRLLRRERFDCVYFSTTCFPVMALGPRWRRLFAVPYILDFQDPWLTSYYHDNGLNPPGGWLKYRLSRSIGVCLEPRVVRESAHIIAVSPAYPQVLRRRYPQLQPGHFTVLPFAASAHDFELLEAFGVPQPIFDPGDGQLHWTYVGVLGPTFLPTLRLLFRELAALRRRDPSLFRKLRLHFVGTTYGPPDRHASVLLPIARRAGLDDLVHEVPQRIPYLQALQILRQAGSVMVLGTADQTYTASKVYPCLLAGRPILALLHRASSAAGFLSASAVDPVCFGEPEVPEQHLRRTLRQRLLQHLQGAAEPPTLCPDLLRRISAEEMTRRQCDVFQEAAREPA